MPCPRCKLSPCKCNQMGKYPPPPSCPRCKLSPCKCNQMGKYPPPPPPAPVVPACKRDIITVGKDLAENPNIGKRIRHSRFADPFRRLSVNRLGQGAVKVAISVIPIPGVKQICARIEEIAYKRLMEWMTKNKLHEHEHDADKANKIKWEWKSPPNIEDFDRYRWKIHHGIEMLWDSYNNLIAAQNESTSICNDAAKAVQKWYYLRRRITKLRDAMERFRAMIEDTDEWLVQVDNKLQRDNMLTRVRNAAQQAHEWNDGLSHLKCDPELCVFGDQSRLVNDPKYKAFLESKYGGKLVGELFSDVTRLFPDITDLKKS